MYSKRNAVKDFFSEWKFPIFCITALLTLAGVLIGVLYVTTGPTDAQRAACTSSGGHVVSKEFTLKKGFWNGLHTGTVHYCEGTDGSMTMVWNKVIKPDTTPHWYGTPANFVNLAKRCTANGGTTYDTSYSTGKATNNVAICVTNGKITDYQD